jgi:hypothetical protein
VIIRWGLDLIWISACAAAAWTLTGAGIWAQRLVVVKLTTGRSWRDAAVLVRARYSRRYTVPPGEQRWSGGGGGEYSAPPVVRRSWTAGPGVTSVTVVARGGSGGAGVEVIPGDHTQFRVSPEETAVIPIGEMETQTTMRAIGDDDDAVQ